MDNNNEEVIYSGSLKKKGGRVNVWGERYFVLKGYTLYYYVKSTDTVSGFGPLTVLYTLADNFVHVALFLGTQGLLPFASK